MLSPFSVRPIRPICLMEVCVLLIAISWTFPLARGIEQAQTEVTSHAHGTLEEDESYFEPTGYDLYVGLITLLMNETLYFVNGTGDIAPEIVAEKCKKVIDALYHGIPFIDDGRLYCNSSWDEYSCWPRTPAGTTAVISCPGYLADIVYAENATKECLEDGTWADKASYVNCLTEDYPTDMNFQETHTTAVRIIYNVGFTWSTLTLVIALSIFLYFKSLRCLRNSIHCHLIVTFILRNVVWIIMRHSLIPIQGSPHTWPCKMLTTLFNYSAGTNFFWMFVEGLYLHIIIVWTYSADKIKLRYLLVIGWGLPAVFIIAWVIVKSESENTGCWMPDTQSLSGGMYDFIYIGPILFVLFANLIFLSTIIWVLITKLRASHSLETRQYRKAVKATIILFPLLGITYVLFIIPPSSNPKVQVVFLYINAVLQSFQGFLVAVFYCFLNGEVKGVLKKKLSRFNDARSLSTKYTKTSVGWTRDGNSIALSNGALMDTKRTPAEPTVTIQETVLSDADESDQMLRKS